MNSEIVCRVCNSGECKEISSGLAECEHCGSFFRISDVEYTELYIDKDYHFDAEWLPIEQAGKALFVKKDVVGQSGLEVGACFGDLIHNVPLTDKYVLDLKPLLREEYSNIEEFVGSYESFKFSRRFDNIIMNNVLEHFNNIHYVFQKTRNLLSQGGRFIIFMPSADFKGHGLESLQKHKDHVTIFSAKALRFMANLFGFEVIRMYSICFNSSMYAVLEKK